MAARSHLKKDALAPVHKRMDRLSGVDVPVLIRTGIDWAVEDDLVPCLAGWHRYVDPYPRDAIENPRAALRMLSRVQWPNDRSTDSNKFRNASFGVPIAS